MKKTLVREVKLKFFQDEATGEHGVSPDNTQDADVTGESHQSFNSSWSALMIFHDVWEHAHEFADEHFHGKYAMNVGGEIAAMGALCYYFSVLNLRKRMRESYHGDTANIISTTQSYITSALNEGRCDYGDELHSNVPRQKMSHHWDERYLDDVIDEHWYQFKKDKEKYGLIEPEFDEKGVQYNESECEASARYLKSVKKRKLADLYRYGFRQAKKLIPNTNSDNREVLEDFWDFWVEFMKRHSSAEELSQQYTDIVFRIYRDEDDLVSWEADFIPDRDYVRQMEDMAEEDPSYKPEYISVRKNKVKYTKTALQAA